MIIKELKTRNYLSLKNCHINFRSGINLIIGHNGAGKSNIIDAIYFSLFRESLKAKKLDEILFRDKYYVSRTFSVELNIGKYYVKRSSNQDLLMQDKVLLNKSKAWITSFFDDLINKRLFRYILLSEQLNQTYWVEATNSERQKVLDKILNLEFYDFYCDLLKEMKKDFQVELEKTAFIIKQYEVNIEDKKRRKKELLNEYKSLQDKINEFKNELERLYQEKEKIEMKKLYDKKEELLIRYWTLKKEYFEKKKKEEKIKEYEKLKNEVEKKMIELKERFNALKKEKEKYQKLLKENKCFYCEREFTEIDKRKYEMLIEGINEKLKEIKEAFDLLKNQQEKLKKEIIELKKVDYKYLDLEKRLILCRKECLELPSIKELKKYKDIKISNEIEMELSKIEELEKLINELEDKIKSIKIQLEIIEKDDKKEEIKKERKKYTRLEREIEKIDLFLDITKKGKVMTKLKARIIKELPIKQIYSLFNLGEIEIDNEFNIKVDKKDIHLCSGAQKLGVSLAIRLAFLSLSPVKFLILDEPTIFLDKERIEFLKKILITVIEKRIILQLIIVSHEESFKEIADFIYKVEKKENESIITQIK